MQGQTGSISFNKRYCVPNSSGPARLNDSTNRAWDMAKANLDATGKPAFNTARTGCGGNALMADCQFTDFSHDTNGGHVPGYTQAANGPTNGLTYTSGASGHPMYHGCAPVVTSATTFGQWWNDGTYESDGTTAGKHAIGTIELAPSTVGGAAGYYQFSSAQNSVYGGFFPLDPPANKFPLYYTQADLNTTNATTGLVNQGSPNGPGRDHDHAGGLERAAPVQPVAVLVQPVQDQQHRVRRRRRLQGRPVSVPAQRLVRHQPERQLDPGDAGLVPRLLVLDRGALPLRLQRPVRPSVLR